MTENPMDYNMANPEATIEVTEEGGYSGRFITFLIAPELPTQELKVLEEYYRECIADPARSLVVNYNLSVSTVFVEPNARLVVVAPDIPPTAREELEASVNDLTVDLLAVNYELVAYTIAVEE